MEGQIHLPKTNPRRFPGKRACASKFRGGRESPAQLPLAIGAAPLTPPQFLLPSLQVGAVGYVCDQITGDSGSGAKLGLFQARVIGIGPQIGFLFPVAGLQGYVNLKGGVRAYLWDRRPALSTIGSPCGVASAAARHASARSDNSPPLAMPLATRIFSSAPSQARK